MLFYRAFKEAQEVACAAKSIHYLQGKINFFAKSEFLQTHRILFQQRANRGKFRKQYSRIRARPRGRYKLLFRVRKSMPCSFIELLKRLRKISMQQKAYIIHRKNSEFSQIKLFCKRLNIFSSEQIVANLESIAAEIRAKG